jgi:hypothetical protein
VDQAVVMVGMSMPESVYGECAPNHRLSPRSVIVETWYLLLTGFIKIYWNGISDSGPGNYEPPPTYDYNWDGE